MKLKNEKTKLNEFKEEVENEKKRRAKKLKKISSHNQKYEYKTSLRIK